MTETCVSTGDMFREKTGDMFRERTGDMFRMPRAKRGDRTVSPYI